MACCPLPLWRCGYLEKLLELRFKHRAYYRLTTRRSLLLLQIISCSQARFSLDRGMPQGYCSRNCTGYEHSGGHCGTSLGEGESDCLESESPMFILRARKL